MITGHQPTQLQTLQTTHELTMSSREVADLVESRHDSVKRSMEALRDRGVISFSQSVETSHDGAGARPVEVYLVNQRDSYVVVAQLSPEFTARLVDRWQALEAKQPKFDPAALTRMDILRLAMESEERCIKAEAQRDQAIATKHLIGSKREATAMATASAAKREVERLHYKLGVNTRHATVKSVEKMTGNRYPWLPLRKWCEANGGIALDVPDPLYGHVKAWPRDAWGEVYAVDLDELFADQARYV